MPGRRADSRQAVVSVGTARVFEEETLTRRGNRTVPARTATSSSPPSGRKLTLSTFLAVTAPVGAVATTVAGATLQGVGVATFRVPASPEWRVFRMISVCHNVSFR